MWRRINELFNYLPLAATIEGKILCMHGGIGRSINKASNPCLGWVRRQVVGRSWCKGVHGSSASS